MLFIEKSYIIIVMIGEYKDLRRIEMGFIEQLKIKAKSNKKTIVLPEGMDRRTYEAAQQIVEEDFADIIILASPEEAEKYGKGYDIENVTIIDPKDCVKTKEYAEEFYMLRNSSANTLRPSLQIIKTKPGSKLVSAFFVMCVQNKELGADGVFVMGDCGLNQNPNPVQLADIAASSAESFEYLVGEKARVAMLSHSTHGSAAHPDVDKVVEATKIAQKEYPQFLIDGELQTDAAVVPKVAALKAPDSPVAGKANVLIFPDLDAGNIGYKLIQRLGNAEAYGPLCQGIAKPVNDLSRGCSAKDIVGVVAITAVQAQIN